MKDNGKRGSEEKLGSADSPAGSSRPNWSLRATLYLVHGACPRASPCLLQLAFSSVTWEYQPLPVLETDYAVKSLGLCLKTLLTFFTVSDPETCVTVVGVWTSLCGGGERGV